MRGNGPRLIFVEGWTARLEILEFTTCITSIVVNRSKTITGRIYMESSFVTMILLHSWRSLKRSLSDSIRTVPHSRPITTMPGRKYRPNWGLNMCHQAQLPSTIYSLPYPIHCIASIIKRASFIILSFFASHHTNFLKTTSNFTISKELTRTEQQQCATTLPFITCVPNAATGTTLRNMVYSAT